MWAQVILLPRGGSSAIDQWLEGTFPQINKTRWERSALEWPNQILKGQPEELEYFICMSGDLLDEGYDSDILHRLLNCARQHTWNANIYLALDQRMDLKEGQIEARAARLNWFGTMQEMGLTDILELPLLGSEMSLLSVKLMNAAARSAVRREVIERCAGEGDWKCIFYRPSEIEKSFLGPFLTQLESINGEVNYLLTVRGKGDRDQLNFIQDVLTIRSRMTFLVARIDKTGEEPTDALQRLCADEGLTIIPDAFRGLFELHLFIQRLREMNSRRHKTLPRMVSGAEAVRLAPQLKFSSSIQYPQLLITHSFDPTDEVEQCIEAARDAYEITKDLPFGTKVIILPAIDCAILPGRISALQSLTAWVHIGHGSMSKGLMESGPARVYKRPDQWLACFESYEGSVPLICFAACQSIEVARHFAEAGAGVVVGFAEDVLLPACRLLAKEVVKAAVISNGNLEKTLKAFELGCSMLYANDYDVVRARAFCSRH